MIEVPQPDVFDFIRNIDEDDDSFNAIYKLANSFDELITVFYFFQIARISPSCVRVSQVLERRKIPRR